MSTPCTNYPVKFVSCCDVMSCIDIHSDNNTITVTKNDCGVDLGITSNNVDNILQINNGSCISFVKEFINGKLVITPQIDWDCVASHVCPICSVAPAEQADIIFSWARLAGDSMDLSSSFNGTTTVVDWGDGTINSLLVHTYVNAGTYTVNVYNNNTTIVILGNKVGPSYFKLATLTKIPSNLVTLDVSQNTLASIPSLSPLTSLVNLFVGSNQLTTLNITANTALKVLYANANLLSGAFTVANNVLLEHIELQLNTITSITNTVNCTNLTLLAAASNNITQASINTIISGLVTNNKINGILTINTQVPPAAPSGGGVTNKATLITRGWTVTTD